MNLSLGKTTAGKPGPGDNVVFHPLGRPSALMIVALLVPLLVGIASWSWGRPWLASDTAIGLLAWDSWHAGGPWNCIAEPAPTNLAQNTFSWVSWWSPGQYVWPGFFLRLGLLLGGALIVSGVVASWIKSLGFYLLLRTLGFGAPAAGLAALVESASWPLYFSFGMYTGGEVLQAAFFPWLMLGFAVLRNRVAWWMLGLPLLAFAAAFAKHSMMMAVLAGAGWLWLESNRAGNTTWRRRLGSGLIVVACLAVAHVAVDRWLINGGPTPDGFGQMQRTWPAAVGYPFFGPWSAATGAGSAIGRGFFLAHLPVEEGWRRAGWALLLLAPVWVWSYARLLRHLPHPAMTRMTAMFLAVYISAMLGLFLGGGSVSMEDRHFQLVGMLLIAAASAVLVESRMTSRFARLTLAGGLAGIALYGLLAAGQRIATLARMNLVGPSGITQPNLSRAATQELCRLDTRYGPSGQVLFLSEPSMAMEASHSRKIVTDALARPLAWFQGKAWHGRVPQLTMVLPANWIDDPRTRALEACFRNYAAGEWHPRIVGNCLFISAGD